MAPVCLERPSLPHTFLSALLFLLLVAPPSLLVCSFSLENSQFRYQGRTFRTWGAVNGVEKAPPDAKIWVYSRINSSWLPVADLRSILHEQEQQGAFKKREVVKGKKTSLTEAPRLVSHAHDPSNSFGSLARFSDASLWVAGPSGSVYERFWNGAQWVFIPHDLPSGSGKASALAAVNRTVIATSENGHVYHMYQNSKQALVWRFCGPKKAQGDRGESTKSAGGQLERGEKKPAGGQLEREEAGSKKSTGAQLERDENGSRKPSGGQLERDQTSSKKPGHLERDDGHLVRGPGMPTGEGGTVFFTTRDGRLAELSNLWPSAVWGYHGAPRDADVAAIADACLMRPNFVLVVSSAGDLYELELRPAHVWRKHSRAGSELEDVPLLPGSGLVMRGAHGVSVFLPTADGRLAERRRSRNAWMWLLHSGPPGLGLSVRGRGPLVVPYQALMAQGGAPPTVSLHVADVDKVDPVLFATAEDGSVWEYQPKFSLPKVKNTKPRASNWRTAKKDGSSSGGDSDQGTWTPHGEAGFPIQPGVTGIELSKKRLVFMLEDGRLIERFLSGAQVNEGWPSDAFWIIVEVPESEGGNAEYCSKERGPSNCLDGVKGRLVKTPPPQQRQAGGGRQSPQNAKKRTDMLTGTDGSGPGLAADQSELGSDDPELEYDDEDEEEDEEVVTEKTGGFGGPVERGWEEIGGGEKVCQRGELSGRGIQCKRVPKRAEFEEVSISAMGGLGSVNQAGGSTPPKQAWKDAFQLRSNPTTGTVYLVGKDGRIAEKRWKNGAWSWRTEDDPQTQTAALSAAFNGSLFTVDVAGNLWLRERISGGWNWQDVSPPNGSEVRGAFPVDWPPAANKNKEQPEAPLYFVSETGNLMEFELDEGGPRWHDVGTPWAGVSVAGIADHGNLRVRSVFCVGTDARIYQFNPVVRKWLFFGQPSYIQLAPQPGAVLRPPGTTKGSLFLRSENRGLVEILWGGTAWSWNEHGQIPGRAVLVAAPVGPAVALPGGGVSILVVGSNGEVYERRKVDEGWSWISHGYPNVANLPADSGWLTAFQRRDTGSSKSVARTNGAADPLLDPVCNPTVAPSRPLSVSPTSAVYLLRDGRLAELRLNRDSWVWVAVVTTPFSTCPDQAREKR